MLFQSTWWFDGKHTHTWQSIDFYFSLPLLPRSSAEYTDRAAWRNPLSRHFSFPVTDGPWHVRAFDPPAWLAARHLNKLSSCYNSLKHFQLPQSNKSCRRDARPFSTSNLTPQRVLLHIVLSGDGPPTRWRGRVFLDKASRKWPRGNWMVLSVACWEEGADFKISSGFFLKNTLLSIHVSTSPSHLDYSLCEIYTKTH